MNDLRNDLIARFPNPPKVQDDLNAFAKHHDRRLYKHLTTCMDVQTDLKGLIKARVGIIVYYLVLIIHNSLGGVPQDHRERPTGSFDYHANISTKMFSLARKQILHPNTAQHPGSRSSPTFIANKGIPIERVAV